MDAQLERRLKDLAQMLEREKPYTEAIRDALLKAWEEKGPAGIHNLVALVNDYEIALKMFTASPKERLITVYRSSFGDIQVFHCEGVPIGETLLVSKDSIKRIAESFVNL